MRKDFYFRLNSSFIVTLSPLRINAWKIEKFCLEFCQKEDVQMDKNVINFYMECPWPGNYRQLLSHLEKKKLTSPSRKFELHSDDYYLMENTGSFSGSFFEQEMSQIVPMAQMKKDYTKWVYFKTGKNLSQTSYFLKTNNNTSKKLLGL